MARSIRLNAFGCCFAGNACNVALRELERVPSNLFTEVARHRRPFLHDRPGNPES